MSFVECLSRTLNYRVYEQCFAEPVRCRNGVRLADIPKALAKEDLKLLCNLTISMITSLPPRLFRAGSMKNPLLTFTDGAWESGCAGGGRRRCLRPEQQSHFLF